MMRLVLGFLLALPLLGSAEAQISCGSFGFAQPFAGAFLDGKPYADAAKAGQTITSIADGACHQDQLLKVLASHLGPVAGYKAAATSAGAQKQLGLDGPVLGVLFTDMMRQSGSTVALTDGARLIFELDLLVRVADPALIDATTREEALAGIDAVLPFIELGDLMVPKGAAVTGPLLQAMNAGARMGVAGDPVPLGGLDADGLAAITGVLAKDGAVVAEAPATALLGHPLDAVLWIAKAAKARGMTFKEGDVLSLGSLGPFQLAAAGTVVARYTIDGKTAEVSVTFE